VPGEGSRGAGRNVMDATVIAERMREEALAVAEHLAETVEVHHDPPAPTDGPMPGALLAEAMRQSSADTSSARTILSLVAEGDRIVQHSIVTTVADGQRSEVAHTAIYRVADGRIVGLESRYEPRGPGVAQRIIGTALNVTDLERSIAFYANALGFCETQRFEFPGIAEVVLHAGGDTTASSIVLVAHEGAEASVVGSFGRLILQVGDASAAAEAVVSSGGKVDGEPVEVPGHGARIVLARDPEGVALELVQLP
jgi:lactoylglutathione lyase